MAKTKRTGRKTGSQPRLPERLQTNNIPTLNGFGVHFPELPFKDLFIRDAAKNKDWSLDIGCAYGLHTIEAIKKGARVVANDLERKHLQILRAKLPTELSLNLRTLPGAFQNATLPDNSIGCAMAANVLHFLDGPTLDRVLEKLYKAMRSGAKVYANSWSPYTIVTKDLIPVFDKRKATRQPWPGYFDSTGGRMGPLMPDEIHVFDIETFSNLFKRHGFVVERCKYFAVANPTRKLDGREVVFITARKP